MEDARRKRKFLHLVFFDLKNAFGSIPHQLLWFSLQRLGLPSEMMDVFRDVYHGFLFKVCSEDGLTDGIPQGRGVKQGCPLSPLLFNLAIEGMLRGIESSSARGCSFSPDLEVKAMSYADNLAIAASSEEDMRAMIDRIEEFTTWAGLRFNVAKCVSLSTGYHDGKRLVFPSEFRLVGRVIPAITATSIWGSLWDQTQRLVSAGSQRSSEQTQRSSSSLVWQTG